MLYFSHVPSRPVGEFVERFWMCADKPLHSRERILPSGAIELVVNLSDDEVRIYDPVRPDRYKRFPGSVVSGAYRSSFIIDPSQHDSIMGVHFKPGGAFPFFGAVVGDLTDMHVSLEELWGSPAIELRERLGAASTPEDRFFLMEEVLTARLCRLRGHHAAVAFAIDAFGHSGIGESVQGIARRVGLSQRRFIQVFTAQVGLTPKLLCRVLRFQQARMLVGRTAKPNVAACCGYFDQSHLIRDFRQFSGMRPTDYLRLRSERVMRNHVPVGD
jgi:AraC-like DNA-binding protein